MKDLATYFECDGAATPATVMGMGNPMAPDGTNPGSGDTLDHQKQRKKVKPGKEKEEWPDDKGQLKEGLLDDDFGMADGDLGLGFNDLLEQFADIWKGKEKLSEKDYEQFFNNFKIVAKEYSASSGIKESIMKCCRRKVYTVMAFYKKGPMNTKATSFQNIIEIRKFIKNPRPRAIATGWYRDEVFSREYDVNHPTNINIRLSELYAMPGDVWDKLNEFIKR